MVASPWKININTQQILSTHNSVHKPLVIEKHRAFVSPGSFVDKNAGFDAFSPALLFAKQ